MMKIVKIAEAISIWTVPVSLYHRVNSAQIPAPNQQLQHGSSGSENSQAGEVSAEQRRG